MRLREWAEESGVAFGTSGARGLVSQLTDRVCFLYTVAFLRRMEERGMFRQGDRVGIGGDLRPSTPRMAAACVEAVRSAGGEPVIVGAISSPALAYYGMVRKMATVMVTGSHIPDDRNGIKFNRPDGEIDKQDEAAIMEQEAVEPTDRFHRNGMWLSPPDVLFPLTESEPHALYKKRAVDFFGSESLAGLRIGFYQHSGVAREMIPSILEALGAEVDRLAPSDRFLPVDTEAIREEDRRLAREWTAMGKYDAIVSTDGDGDRPLLADETGEWWSGDRLGLLAARELEIEAVAVPVSTTTAAELTGWFRTERTRIGSPYVIEGMRRLRENGAERVAGFEANGGFLLETRLVRNGREIAPLPTRDVVLPLVAVLARAAKRRVPLSSLSGDLPRRATASDRLREFPGERSGEILAALREEGPFRSRMIGSIVPGGEIAAVDWTDGCRISLKEGEVIHLRPSGNAPEFRCYIEGTEKEEAERILGRTLKWMEEMRRI